MKDNLAGGLGGTGRCPTFLLFPRPIAPHKLPHPTSSLHEELPDLCRSIGQRAIPCTSASSLSDL